MKLSQSEILIKCRGQSGFEILRKCRGRSEIEILEKMLQTLVKFEIFAKMSRSGEI